MVLFFTHIPFVVNHTINATPPESLQHCCCRNPWCDCHVTHTPKCNQSAKIRQIINCGLTILIVSVCPVLLPNYDTAQIWRCWQNGRYFTKRIWQPCICQPNELKREIRKKTGGPGKNLGGPWPTRPPRIESPLCAKYNPTYMWREQAIIEWSSHVNSIVACCHSVKLCAHIARAFWSQQ